MHVVWDEGLDINVLTFCHFVSLVSLIITEPTNYEYGVYISVTGCGLSGQFIHDILPLLTQSGSSVPVPIVPSDLSMPCSTPPTCPLSLRPFQWSILTWRRSVGAWLCSPGQGLDAGGGLSWGIYISICHNPASVMTPAWGNTHSWGACITLGGCAITPWVERPLQVFWWPCTPWVTLIRWRP